MEIDNEFSSTEYTYVPGDVVTNKITNEKCVILRQLPIRSEDVGMKEKYYVRRPCGRKVTYYNVELTKQ